MKVYCADFNGILTDLRTRIGPTNLVNPRDADALIVWQDVLGSYGDLVRTMKQCGIQKPVFTVQHGRAATSDYAAPNSFKFNSDYFLCWGQSDFDRMTKLGYGDKSVIVGCPLNIHIKPKVQHNEKVVLFVPVNTGKEEPENLSVYYELLKIKYSKAGSKLRIQSAHLKDKWDMTSNKACEDFDVVAKLLPWHDQKMYHGKTLVGSQYDPGNNRLIFELLRNVDLVVGIDEGCTEIFAYAHDVPVIIVDGFKYRQYKEDGKSYETTGVYTTDAATHVTLDKLSEAINYALAHPEHKREERRKVAEAEMGLSFGNPIENIYKFVRSKTRENVKA